MVICDLRRVLRLQAAKSHEILRSFSMCASAQLPAPLSLQLGEGVGEGPPLWGVAELAAPLVARLRRHFGGAGMPTDRTDRPVRKQHCPLLCVT